MEVRIGWSQEIQGQWAKLDVAIEELDIQRVLAENSISPEHSISLTGVETFQLMEALAEIDIMIHQMTQYAEFYNTKENGLELQKHVATKKKILTSLRDRVGL